MDRCGYGERMERKGREEKIGRVRTEEGEIKRENNEK